MWYMWQNFASGDINTCRYNDDMQHIRKHQLVIVYTGVNRIDEIYVATKRIGMIKENDA